MGTTSLYMLRFMIDLHITPFAVFHQVSNLLPVKGHMFKDALKSRC